MADKRVIDLHTHSNASDGTLSPAALARSAKEKGIAALALTDHDTLDGAPSFLDECGKNGVFGIAGVEISAEHDRTMHIVGLFVDESNAELKDRLERLRGGRGARNREMLRLLRRGGFDIDESDILSQKDGASLENSGRPHIARALVSKGYAENVNEAFEKYLKRGRPFYVKRLSYTPEECIDMIISAGGVPVLAHPNLISEDADTLFPIVKALKEAGLGGMECYYNNYTPAFARICFDICERLSLAPSGGSDFHGGNKPNAALGRVSSGTVPYSVLEGIIKIREERYK